MRNKLVEDKDINVIQGIRGQIFQGTVAHSRDFDFKYEESQIRYICKETDFCLGDILQGER